MGAKLKIARENNARGGAERQSFFPEKILFARARGIKAVSLGLYPGIRVFQVGEKLSKNFNPRGTPFLIFQFLRQKIIR